MWKKAPVLTQTLCTNLEMLRAAIEVATGERTCFIQIDFNTNRGKVRVGTAELEVSFTLRRNDLISFDIGAGWNDALIEEGMLVKVCNVENPHVLNTSTGECTLRWVGHSASDRREEPLFLENAQHCAKVRGLTLEQLLATAK